MELSDTGVIEIITEEGISVTKYKDSEGVWTIGCGMTSTEIPDLATWPLTKTLTLNDVVLMFRAGMVPYENAVNSNLKVSIKQCQFDALVSFTYNVGVGGEAHSTLVKVINNKGNNTQIENAFMMWTKNKELVGRREREVNLYINGVYSSTGFAAMIPSGKPVNIRTLLAMNTPSQKIAADAPQRSVIQKMKDFLTKRIG